MKTALPPLVTVIVLFVRVVVEACADIQMP